ncbi:MAG: hypothetical protein ACK4OE_04495 [Acidovorax sp.]|uniref:hypothetical protein n=1 Tax=Acidovorax sp. TaxID=1872122 RepID=UPI00391C8EF4
MLTFESFTGINNVAPAHRLSGADLLVATDVDIGLTGEITRRAGFTEVHASCHKNIYDGKGFMLATTGSELVAIHPGDVRHVIHPSIGPGRVWYCNLPDGRTTYTNGLIHGTTDGVTCQDRSVPVPHSLGAPDTAFGDLFPGQYRYHLTARRMADGAESPAISSTPITISQGGLRLDGLPVRLGYEVLVYLSGKDGEGAYLVGSTSGSTFEWGGKNSDLVLPCRTLGARPFPVGTYTAFWRGRVLTAVGNVLWASRPFSPHLSDWRDFKQFEGDITAVLPVLDGVYVGTTEGLKFLSGTTWDQLAMVDTRRGAVVPGSGISAPGKKIQLGEGKGSGDAMLCIAGGEIVAGFNGGQTFSLTSERYTTAVTEVCAAFREIDGIPQYIAVPQ